MNRTLLKSIRAIPVLLLLYILFFTEKIESYDYEGDGILYPNIPFYKTHADIDGDSIIEFFGYNYVSFENSAELFQYYRNGSLVFIAEYPYKFFLDAEWHDTDGDNLIDIYGNRKMWKFINGSMEEQDIFLLKDNENQCYTYFGQVERLRFGDIDCDGDLDAVVSNGLKHTWLTLMNDGKGTFNFDPAYVNGLPLSKYGKIPSGAHNRLIDLNNDGWLDICSTRSRTILEWHTNNRISLGYMWLYDGNGTWHDFSGGLPKDDYGVGSRASQCEDFDNDGDLDLIANMKDRGIIFFENRYPRDWRLIDFPFKEEGQKTINLVDHNHDGLVDIVVGNLNYETGFTLVLYTNMGDWVFEPKYLYKNDRYHYEVKDVIDIDMDGSMEILLSNSTMTYPLGISWIVEVIDFCDPNPNELFFSYLMNGDVLRAGMYTKMEWSSNRKYELVHQNIGFNVSISFLGKGGPYHPLKTDFHRWWTYWVVPDFPTNDAYLKVEGAGLTTYHGPVTIFSRNDTKYLIDAHIDPPRPYYRSGEEVNIHIVPSNEMYHPTGYDLQLFTPSGTFDIGNYSISPGENIVINFTIPDNYLEMKCNLVSAFEYEGNDVRIDHDERFNILAGDHIIGSMSHTGMNEFGIGLEQTYKVTIKAETGKDITDLSEIRFKSDGYVIDTLSTDSDSISIRGIDHGSESIGVNVYYLGVERDFNIPITIRRSVSSIGLHSYAHDLHTGDEIAILTEPKDALGKFLKLSEDELDWSLEGDAYFRSCGHERSYIIPCSPGDIKVDARVDLGDGACIETLRFSVSPTIGNVTLLPSNPHVDTGYMSFMDIEVRKYDGSLLKDYSMDWSIVGDLSYEVLSDSRVAMSPLSNDPISIDIRVHYLNETRDESFIIVPGVGIVEFEIEDLNGYVPVLENSIYSISAQGPDGSLVNEDWNITIVPSIADHIRYEDGSLFFYSERAKQLNFTLELRHHDRLLWRNYSVEFFEIPNRLYLPDPVLVRSNEMVSSFELRDRFNSSVHPDVMDIRSDKIVVSIIDKNISMKCDELGVHLLTIDLVMHGHRFEIGHHVRVVPSIDRIGSDMDDMTMRLGDVRYVSLIPYLETGEPCFNYQYQVFSDPGLTIERGKQILRLTAYIEGEYVLSLQVQYHNQLFTETALVRVLSHPRLSVIDLFMGDDDVLSLIAYDQYGIDITDDCEISWYGDHVMIDANSVVPVSGVIRVLVVYDGIELEGEYDAGIDPDFVGVNDPITLKLIIVGSILVLLIAGILLIARRRGTLTTGSREE